MEIYDETIVDENGVQIADCQHSISSIRLWQWQPPPQYKRQTQIQMHAPNTNTCSTYKYHQIQTKIHVPNIICEQPLREMLLVVGGTTGGCSADRAALELPPTPFFTLSDRKPDYSPTLSISRVGKCQEPRGYFPVWADNLFSVSVLFQPKFSLKYVDILYCIDGFLQRSEQILISKPRNT